MSDEARRFCEELRATDWERDFSSPVRDVGLALVRKGVVRRFLAGIVGPDKMRLSARVGELRERGAHWTMVTLEVEPGGGLRIDISCGCADPQSQCRHGYALLSEFARVYGFPMRKGPTAREAHGAAKAEILEAGRAPTEKKPPRKKKKRAGSGRIVGKLGPLCLVFERVASGAWDALLTTKYKLAGVTSQQRLCDTGEFFDRVWRAALPGDEQRVLLDRLRELYRGGKNKPEVRFHPQGASWAKFLLAFISEGGLCHYRSGKHVYPLSSVDRRKGRLGWKWDAAKRDFRTVMKVDPDPDDYLPVAPPLFLDLKRFALGFLETGYPDAVSARWISTPHPSEEDLRALARLLAKSGSTRKLPAKPEVEREDCQGETPRPVLRLYPSELPRNRMRSVWSPVPVRSSVAALQFCYRDTFTVPENGGDDTLESSGIMVLRNEEAEAGFVRALEEATGLQRFASSLPDNAREPEYENLRWPGTWEADAVGAFWLRFFTGPMVELEKEGWQIDVVDGFEYRFVRPDSWKQRLKPTRKKNWFDFELGIVCGDEEIDLLPILVAYFESMRSDGRSLDGFDGVEARIPVPLGDGRFLAFPVERLQPILRVLRDLLGEGLIREGAPVRLHALAAADMTDGEAVAEASKRIQTQLRNLKEALGANGSLPEIALPRRFQAELRDYQRTGFHWLQFLCRVGLAGILADDMGLGKTLQMLCHLAAEKEEGRLAKPALVVAPTSVLSNWQREAERFTPGLITWIHHGPNRNEHWDKVDAADVIITSYALLQRDEEEWLARSFAFVILDEAQYIKNPASKSARLVCRVRSEHRFCLTGTPMENHLEELWSLFHFLLPGFLGTLESFRRHFRHPIERDGNRKQRELLARRVNPFLLRRRKDDVLSELPPKTEILRTVELTGDQRDLYETIRVSMEDRVREFVAEQGIGGSQIYLLDALLKLRQVCCHPRLLKMESARGVEESAKTDLLFELLESLMEEQRSVLIFSQFTSMLAIIEERLAAAGTGYVKLTGSSRNRDALIDRFQSGEVPVFLVSLKAGGVGLNLTRADTVVHYDPWWNPAVENQATDRAHRMGQEKPVFVYKLLTAGTIEERILALQQEKQALVDSMLSGSEKKRGPALGLDDLDHLFAPIGS